MQVRVAEHRQPFSKTEADFVKYATAHFASLAELTDLPDKEKALWRDCIANSGAPGYFMNRDDSYFREGHALAIAQAPDEM